MRISLPRDGPAAAWEECDIAMMVCVGGGGVDTRWPKSGLSQLSSLFVRFTSVRGSFPQSSSVFDGFLVPATHHRPSGQASYAFDFVRNISNTLPKGKSPLSGIIQVRSAKYHSARHGCQKGKGCVGSEGGGWQVSDRPSGQPSLSCASYSSVP